MYIEETGTILFYKPFTSYMHDSSLRRQLSSLWVIKRNVQSISIQYRGKTELTSIISISVVVTVSKPREHECKVTLKILGISQKLDIWQKQLINSDVN